MAFSAFRPQGTPSTQFGFGSIPAPSFQQPQMQMPQQQPQMQMLQQQQQQQNTMGQNQQQIHLFTTERTPVTYQTKWADIHPDSQKLLLQIEERILEYRDESRRLDQCVRLYDTSALNQGFELDAARILQELGGNSTAIERENVLLQELMNVVKGMLRNAEVAVRSFMIIRPRFIRPTMSAGVPQPGTTVAGSTSFLNSTTPQMSTATTSMMDFYSGLPTKPSSFLQQTVARFERQLAECRQWIEELERLLLSASNDTGSSSSDLTLLQSLPSVISNIHDFFIFVAAEVETLHQRIESMRAAYLADQRRRGDESDPFLEADRREVAKREAAAKRFHPALHASSFPQPSTQVAGLFMSSPAPASAFSGMSNSTQSSPGSFPSSSGAGFSMFNTPSSSSSSSSSFLFSMPTASATGSSVATQTQTMFGSSQTPSMFAANTSSSIFPSAAAAASSSSMFSMAAFGTGSTSSGGLYGASSGSSTSLFGASSSPATGLFVGGSGTASGTSFGTNTLPKRRTGSNRGRGR